MRRADFRRPDDKFCDFKTNLAGRWIDREGVNRKARWAVAEFRTISVYRRDEPLLVLVKVRAWVIRPVTGAARDAKQRRYWGIRGRKWGDLPPGHLLMIVEAPFYSRWRVIPREVSENET